MEAAHIGAAALTAASARVNKSAGQERVSDFSDIPGQDGPHGELRHEHLYGQYSHAHEGGDRPHSHPVPDDHDPTGTGVTSTRTGNTDGKVPVLRTPTTGTGVGAGRSPLTADTAERKPADFESPAWSKTTGTDLLFKGAAFRSRSVRSVGSGRAAQKRAEAADLRAMARTMANPQDCRARLELAAQKDREADELEGKTL